MGLPVPTRRANPALLLAGRGAQRSAGAGGGEEGARQGRAWPESARRAQDGAAEGSACAPLDRRGLSGNEEGRAAAGLVPRDQALPAREALFRATALDPDNRD